MSHTYHNYLSDTNRSCPLFLVFLFQLSSKRKLTSMACVLAGSATVFLGIGSFSGNEVFYKNILMPGMQLITTPEQAHRLAVNILKWNLVPRQRGTDPDVLKTNVYGLSFNNPVGVAAGFDKDGECVHGLFRCGFGFVEVGSVTPLPQPGNPKPRVFRLREDHAVINRYGFNSSGHEGVLASLCATRSRSGPLGVNLGKNKESEDAAQDYVQGLKKFGEVADYVVVNISSPNTPGLRGLQRQKDLRDLLQKVLEQRDQLAKRLPVLVKIAPDLTDEEKNDIAVVVTSAKCKVDGLIVSNTTVSRPENLKSKHKSETGGLSGLPLKSLSTSMISDMYRLTKGVGGISCGQDAYEKIRAGASLVQLYTALVYEGPPLIRKVKMELADLLVKDGFKTLSDAVGADHRK
ncbi:dihydroorotate dehydrogenase (quinone), mitochondrial-like isoform X2 [Ornithodoros turicata]|uniref:dihydroorotate dehydrogenase (quinone), mitochondrial-like isoform X2 n=1 Tax=Ornithodoros turicata TaxID=34597 RepID=UPI00313945C2